MSKKLNTDIITNELEGASLFFTKPTTPPPSGEAKKEVIENQQNISSNAPDAPVIKQQLPETQKIKVEKIEKPNRPKVEVDNRRDTMTPRNHDTTVSRYHDTTAPSIHGVEIEVVRKAVKEFGKEAATHRFTEAEKKQIADLIYTYKNQGVKTSENEITRIAVNFIMQDYKENGENSVLDKILKALNE